MSATLSLYYCCLNDKGHRNKNSNNVYLALTIYLFKHKPPSLLNQFVFSLNLVKWQIFQLPFLDIYINQKLLSCDMAQIRKRVFLESVDRLFCCFIWTTMYIPQNVLTMFIVVFFMHIYIKHNILQQPARRTNTWILEIRQDQSWPRKLVYKLWWTVWEIVKPCQVRLTSINSGSFPLRNANIDLQGNGKQRTGFQVKVEALVSPLQPKLLTN